MCSSDLVFQKYKQDSSFCVHVSGILQLAKTGPPVAKNFPLLHLFLSDAMMAKTFYTRYDVNCTNLHSQSKITINLADNTEKRLLLLFWPFS